MVRDTNVQTLGSFVDFACHPTHYGGNDEISAGFPGVVALKMKDVECPVTLYLNGLYGNITTIDHRFDLRVSMEDARTRLFEDVKRACDSMTFADFAELAVSKETVELPFRDVTEDAYHGKVFGAQRFRSDELYENAEFLKSLHKNPNIIPCYRSCDVMMIILSD